jgi:hypothetical protein
MALEKGQHDLHVFGDSSVAINWMIGRSRMDNLFLLPILNQLKQVESSFLNVSFIHVYRELNAVVNLLSKEGLSLDSTTAWSRSTRRVLVCQVNHGKSI